MNLSEETLSRMKSLNEIQDNIIKCMESYAEVVQNCSENDPSIANTELQSNNCVKLTLDIERALLEQLNYFAMEPSNPTYGENPSKPLSGLNLLDQTNKILLTKVEELQTYENKQIADEKKQNENEEAKQGEDNQPFDIETLQLHAKKLIIDEQKQKANENQELGKDDHLQVQEKKEIDDEKKQMENGKEKLGKSDLLSDIGQLHVDEKQQMEKEKQDKTVQQNESNVENYFGIEELQYIDEIDDNVVYETPDWMLG